MTEGLHDPPDSAGPKTPDEAGFAECRLLLRRAAESRHIATGDGGTRTPSTECVRLVLRREVHGMPVGATEARHRVVELFAVRDTTALGLDLLSIGGKERLLALDHRDERQAPLPLGMGVRAPSRHIRFFLPGRGRRC